MNTAQVPTLRLMQLPVAAGIHEISEFRVVESNDGLVFVVNTLVPAHEAIGGDELVCVANDDMIQELARRRFPHTWNTYDKPFGLFYIDIEFDDEYNEDKGHHRDWDQSDTEKFLSTYIEEEMPGSPISEENIGDMFSSGLLSFEKFGLRLN